MNNFGRMWQNLKHVIAPFAPLVSISSTFGFGERISAKKHFLTKARA